MKNRFQFKVLCLRFLRPRVLKNPKTNVQFLTKQVHVSAKILIKPFITLYDIFIINLGGPAQQGYVVIEIFFVIVNLKKFVIVICNSKNAVIKTQLCTPEGQIQILGG